MAAVYGWGTAERLGHGPDPPRWPQTAVPGGQTLGLGTEIDGGDGPMGGSRRLRMGPVAVAMLLGLLVSSCGGSTSSSSKVSPPPTAKGAVTAGTTTTSSAGTTSGLTLTVHIYLCQQYTSNGVPDLETSTTEISGGTVTVSGVTSSAQPNPYSTSVSQVPIHWVRRHQAVTTSPIAPTRRFPPHSAMATRVLADQ